MHTASALNPQEIIKNALGSNLPPMLDRVLRAGLNLEQPLKVFDCPLVGNHPEVKAQILVLAYEKPASVVALRIVGENSLQGKTLTFLRHEHPAGEVTLQLQGQTHDGEESFRPGSIINLPPGSIHQPMAQLDRSGVYLAITYWPQNTVVC